MGWMAENTSRVRTLLSTLNDPGRLERWSDDSFARGERVKGFIGREVAVLSMAVRRVLDENITRRAAALAFSTLLALVPLMAVALALFKAFGGLATYEAEFRTFVLENLATTNTEEISAWLDQVVGNVSAGAIAGIGVLVLFYTAISLLTNIERTFDQVWGSSRHRSHLARFAIYWSAITLAPVLLAASLSLSASLYTQMGERFVERLPLGLGAVILEFASIVPIVAAQIFVYLVVPTSRIPLRYAVSGALLAGVLFTLGKRLFVTLTASSAQHSAIYGALAALPLLMMWLQLSWTFVLLGLSYAKARQQVACGRPLGEERAVLSVSERQRLALVSLALMVRRWRNDEPPLDRQQLAQEIAVDEGFVEETIDALIAAKLVAEADDGRLLVAADPTLVSLARVARAAEGPDQTDIGLRGMPVAQSASRLMEGADIAWQAALGDSLEHLARSTHNGKPPPRRPEDDDSVHSDSNGANTIR